MLLQELIEILVKDFECDAAVAPENERTPHLNHIAATLGVFQQGSLEDLHLHFCLLQELLLAFNQLQGNELFLFMIEDLKDFSKRTAPQLRNDFVTVGDTVLHHHLRVTLPISEVAAAEDSAGPNIEELISRDFLLF